MYLFFSQIFREGNIMIRAYFIVNQVAGKGIIDRKLGSIVDGFTKYGYEVTVHTSQSSQDIVYAARYASECGGFDCLFCAGGDGTLSQCLQGIMKSRKRIPIGYIPVGSTNDFAATLGMPKEIDAAVDKIIHGKPTACDIGAINSDFFTYIAAFGAFTSISYETPQFEKNILGHAAYILNGMTELTRIRSYRIGVEYDGVSFEDDFCYGMVTNTTSVAGLLSMKDFSLNDGLFEVTLIKKPANILQFQRIVSSLLNIKEEIDKDYIKFFRTNYINFTSINREPILWTRDGERGGATDEAEVKNCKEAVEFIL